MSDTPVGEKSLQVVNTRKEVQEHAFKKPTVPKKKKVLDEDTYTGKVEKIIVRDFYPDLPKLKAQSEYIEALQRNDLQKLRELHIKYGPKNGPTATPNLYSTPATFETPESRSGETPQTGGSQGDDGSAGGQPQEPTHNPEPTKKEKCSLDAFLAKTTSEDNASFSEIMRVNEEKHREKHSWLYEQEEERRIEAEKTLALPSVEQQALTDGNTTGVDTWQYSAKNHLMYVPDGAPESAKEIVERAKAKPRQIIHSNSRFVNDPFDLTKSKKTIQQAAEFQAQNMQGKIGPDGKEILPAQSPSVNGFGFMATPSPAPGVDESPLMTWGEIEGTPFRLDASDTPAAKTPGPKFRMAGVPRRDQILHDLADEIGKAHRAKKKEALDRVKRLASPSPRFGTSRSERLAGMSPAAKRLASTKLGIRTHTDKALRASYTPSPMRKTPGSKTPLGATPTPTLTPAGSSSRRGTPKVPAPAPAPETVSLTDNLLNLRKRPSATDFF